MPIYKTEATRCQRLSERFWLDVGRDAVLVRGMCIWEPHKHLGAAMAHPSVCSSDINTTPCRGMSSEVAQIIRLGNDL